MYGADLDTARHAACAMSNTSWCLKVLKGGKKHKTIRIVISADHENMSVFTHLHHLNEFH